MKQKAICTSCVTSVIYPLNTIFDMRFQPYPEHPSDKKKIARCTVAIAMRFNAPKMEKKCILDKVIWCERW